MQKEQLDKFKQKFYKNFISTLTSREYQIPANTKQQATLKWLEVSIIFDNTVKQIEKQWIK